MQKAISIFLVSILCLIPFVSSGQSVDELQARINTLLQQIQALQEKIAATSLASTPTAPSTSTRTGCPVISRVLAVGARGDDVVQLQTFLKAGGYFTEEATGYFGALTEAAVRRLQVANSIVSSGTAATTGYGSLGPRTRTLIAGLCAATKASLEAAAAAPAATASASTTMQCPAIASAVAPPASCVGTWEKLMSLGCHIGWRCVLSQNAGNKPPLISSIDGPATLGVGVFASWKVNAIDPESGLLSYSVTWGDEGLEEILRSIAGLTSSFAQSSIISHSYAKTGTYTADVSVRDSAGNISVATFSVKVSVDAPAANTGNTFDFIPPLATTTVSASCVTPWGAQLVLHGGMSAWQPFFTEGSYFTASSTPVMRCANGGWQKCDSAGNSCQPFAIATSTSSGAALRSYPGTIGTSCPSPGATLDVSVPPGTQLCQWLSCSITTETQTVKLRCTDSGWTDFVKN